METTKFFEHRKHNKVHLKTMKNAKNKKDKFVRQEKKKKHLQKKGKGKSGMKTRNFLNIENTTGYTMESIFFKQKSMKNAKN